MVSNSKIYKNVINQFKSSILKQLDKFDYGKVSSDSLIRYNVFDGYLFRNLGFTFNDGKYTFRFKARVGTKIDRNTLCTEIRGNKIFIGIGNLDFHFIESDDGIIDYIKNINFYNVSDPRQFDPYDCLMANGEKINEYDGKVRKSLCDTTFFIRSIDSKKFFPGCSNNMIPLIVIDTENNRYGYYNRRNALNTKSIIYCNLDSNIENDIVGNTPDSIFLVGVSKFGENLSR